MTTPDYDTDYAAWADTQAAALRAKKWAALDIDHLAEEIEDLGGSIRKGLVSQLERLLLHLLKWRYDPAENRSLHGYPAERLADAYHYARRVAVLDTELPLTTFPETCPWTVDQVLNEEFLPDTIEGTP